MKCHRQKGRLWLRKHCETIDPPYYKIFSRMNLIQATISLFFLPRRRSLIAESWFLYAAGDVILLSCAFVVYHLFSYIPIYLKVRKKNKNIAESISVLKNILCVCLFLFSFKKMHRKSICKEHDYSFKPIKTKRLKTWKVQLLHDD